MMKYNNQPKANSKVHGFTIIESLVALVILGIITAIAYPSYQTYLQKGRRADAQVALTKGTLLIEKYFYETGGYSSDASLFWPSSKSTQEYYSMSIVLNTAACGGTPCYVLTATARGIQASDSDCATFTLDSQEDKGSTGGGDCWP